jgi:hypothetical protein
MVSITICESNKGKLLIMCSVKRQYITAGRRVQGILAGDVQEIPEKDGQELFFSIFFCWYLFTTEPLSGAGDQRRSGKEECCAVFLC